MLSNRRLGGRILEILMKGVSTRHYREVIPQMAETVGGSAEGESRDSGLRLLGQVRLPRIFFYPFRHQIVGPSQWIATCYGLGSDWPLLFKFS